MIAVIREEIVGVNVKGFGDVFPPPIEICFSTYHSKTEKLKYFPRAVVISAS